ncbi:MAG: hypothetical protein WC609_02470 [Candidatus Paceibacterota bacterium]
MHQLLQWLGGGFYLLNKIFLTFSEYAHNRGDKKTARRWRIASWVIYLVGLPPWVIIFIVRHNWIAASVEASGIPAMLLGLVIAFRDTTKNPPRWLDRFALVCIPVGFAYSFYDFGGLNTINQWLEIGLVVGFLVGTYLLAKENANGYLWYVLMHITCGRLMWIQGYPWLFLQQVISLGFILDAYRVALKQKRRKP